MYQIIVFIQSRMLRSFKEVSEQDARKIKYYGLGGWLLLFLLLYVFLFLDTLRDLAIWNGMPLPDFIDEELNYEVGTFQIINLASYFVILAAILAKKPWSQKVWIIATWLSLIAGLPMLAQNTGSNHPTFVLFTGIGIAINTLLTWYILNSRRVNVTFANRVDPSATEQSSLAGNIKPRREGLSLFWKYLLVLLGTLFGLVLITQLLSFL